MALLTGNGGPLVRMSKVTCVIAAAVTLVAGCGTNAAERRETTTPPPTTSSGPPAGAVDVAALDVGNYQTKPGPPLGTAGTEFKGKLLDARRMANYVLGPWEVDPTLLKTYTRFSGMVLKSADALNLIEPKEVAAAAGRHPFVNGFYSARTNDQTILINAVVRYADDAAATAAAKDMVQEALNEPTSGATRSSVTIAGHPDALATSYPFTDIVTRREQATVNAFTPHGRYVLLQVVQSYDGLDAARTSATKTLDAQVPLIDQFAPTAPNAFAELVVDPTGLLARTLLQSPKEADVVHNSTYDQHGELHFLSDPVDTVGLLTNAGVDLVANGKTSVYQAINAVGAATLVDAFAKQVTGTDGTPVEPVKGLPLSKCVKATVEFYCVASVGRYAFDGQGVQLADVQQQIAAQYAILSAS